LFLWKLVFELIVKVNNGYDSRVLILVFVEVGFWDFNEYEISIIRDVLILVFVEVGFWVNIWLLKKSTIIKVLILVFVEVGFWGRLAEKYPNIYECLNPCFCGSWFLREFRACWRIWLQCLNPCFCGSWFLRLVNLNEINEHYSLNPCFCGSWFLSWQRRNLCFVADLS